MNPKHQAALSSYGAILLSTFINLSCFQEPRYAAIPQISFKGISRYTLNAGAGVGQSRRDSLVITVGFTDGDGDLGNDLPLNTTESDRYKQTGGWGNYRIRAFRLENNQYKEQAPGENNFLTFPRLGREGKTGPIEGQLEFRQRYNYGDIYRMYPTKYRIQVRDRALNISNEIETDTISVPYYR